MKRIVNILLIIVLAAFAAFDAQAADPGAKAGVKFETLSFDFGNVKEDAGKVVHVFEFTNTGTSAVSVLRAKASCGCTVPKFSRKPVEPGQKGRVTVTFRTKGQRGEQNKSVRVRLKNADGKSEDISLLMTGVVVP